MLNAESARQRTKQVKYHRLKKKVDEALAEVEKVIDQAIHQEQTAAIYKGRGFGTIGISDIEECLIDMLRQLGYDVQACHGSIKISWK